MGFATPWTHSLRSTSRCGGSCCGARRARTRSRPSDSHRLAGARTKNVFTPIDFFPGATDKSLTTATASGNVICLGLIYDTHPIRASAGSKYEL